MQTIFAQFNIALDLCRLAKLILESTAFHVLVCRLVNLHRLHSFPIFLRIACSKLRHFPASTMLVSCTAFATRSYSAFRCASYLAHAAQLPWHPTSRRSHRSPQGGTIILIPTSPSLSPHRPAPRPRGASARPPCNRTHRHRLLCKSYRPASRCCPAG